jgi:hypothetical protein
MFDLETNKAIALRLVEVFNGRRLDLLEDVLHPEFRGRGISAFPPEGPEVGPGARRKLYEMFYQAIPDARARCSTLSRKATRSYSSIASVVRIAGSSSDVPARAIASSGWRSTSTPFVTAKSSKTPS